MQKVNTKQEQKRYLVCGTQVRIVEEDNFIKEKKNTIEASKINNKQS